MRARGKLFTTTALIELGAGLALLAVPGLGIWLLLGVRDPSAEALAVGRVCGASLLALGVACWFARDDGGSRSQRGLLWGMAAYNIGVCCALVAAWSVTHLGGPGLWPVVALHVAMTAWLALVMASPGTGTPR